MLGKELLEAYIWGFYGYGEWNAKYWFIGTEEGMRKLKDPEKMKKKIDRRLQAWNELRRKDVQDRVAFNKAISPNKNYGENAPLIPAYNKIIHAILGIKEKPHKRAEVRIYQNKKLARENGESSLLELLPLPNPNLHTWLYSDYSRLLSFLETRDTYEEHVIPKRVVYLKAKIEQYRPQAVVFYGKRNWKDFRQIAGVRFKSTKSKGVKIGTDDKTVFILTKAPVAFGTKNKEFYEMGQLIASSLGLYDGTSHYG
jgi:hypothetical protein